ncbi:hypothetical protein [Paraburkholderia sp. SG-MS1]|uniref:hypothetical protein n=1 Tax=Paraburkholderia sp. SG-MS1 TaxID=2023741 RepID=UPI001446482E|nr:hypothetical protein [Paraburkholderia sp. SG-MS1]
MLLNRKARAASKAHPQPHNENKASPEKAIAETVGLPALGFQDTASLEAFGQRAHDDALVLHEAMRTAERDRSLIGVLERIRAERLALFEELGVDGEIESAARRSVSEGVSVREALQARAHELRHTRERLLADRQKKRAAAAERSADAAPRMRRAIEQMWNAQTEARRLESLIAGFASAKLARHEELRSIGLDEAQITAIGIRPTDADRAEWVAALEANREQERHLSTLLRRGATAFVPYAENAAE